MTKEKEKKAEKTEKIVLVVGVIDPDVHVKGKEVLKKAFEEAGFKIIDIGVRRPQEAFIQAAVENNAQAIMISSSDGEAKKNCQGIREKCIEAGLDNILLYIGGMLNELDDRPWQEVWKEQKIEIMFKNFGFDRVYPPERYSVFKAIRDLKKDLGLSK